MDTRLPQEPQQRPSKKAYRGPALTNYGDVTQLTRGASGSGTDGGAPGMSMVCWIAEALYGMDSPRVLLVRSWLLQAYDQRRPWARVIVPLYRRFGRTVAAGVRRNSLLRGLFRPLFDFAVVKAHREFAPRAALLSLAA